MRNRWASLLAASLVSGCGMPTGSQVDDARARGIEQTAPQYPLGGFLFTGTPDTLRRVRLHGEGLGLKFSDAAQSQGQPALLLPADEAFGRMEAIKDLMGKSQAGTFGQVQLGLLSEPERW